MWLQIQKANTILGCMVESSSQKIHSTLHLNYCIQFFVFHFKKYVDKLDHVQRRTNMARGLETKFYEELKELGLFILKKTQENNGCSLIQYNEL